MSDTTTERDNLRRIADIIEGDYPQASVCLRDAAALLETLQRERNDFERRLREADERVAVLEAEKAAHKCGVTLRQAYASNYEVPSLDRRSASAPRGHQEEGR